jgi:hypothetical protein
MAHRIPDSSAIAAERALSVAYDIGQEVLPEDRRDTFVKADGAVMMLVVCMRYSS